jgi:hypothetical protein
MNPRHRRLLIPGLLIALLVVVLVSSLARRADGAEGGPDVVSRMSDPRIVESSGLAISVMHDDLAYTINDSGNAPIVFAVEVSTGTVVGTARLTGGAFVDTEAIAIDAEGELWVADTGDNNNDRTDAALYAFPEAGRGDHTVTATRYPVTYDAGPQNVEALLVSPATGEKFLVSKGLFGGSVFSVPDRLTSGKAFEATEVGGSDMPALVTDGAMSADGRYALVRTYTDVSLYDARGWKLIRSHETPSQPQGESIAIERSQHSYLIGSEGENSALIRIPLTLPEPEVTATRTPRSDATAAGTNKTSADGNGFAGGIWLWAVGVVALLAAIASAASRRT